MHVIAFIKKIFGLLLLALTLFSAFSFAKDDCEDIDGPKYTNVLDNFLSADDLEIARNHLRSYCCVERSDLPALRGKCTNLVSGPESPYWYDHLIDVGLRKLDAESLYPGMVPDVQGKEWRDFLKNTQEVKNPESFQKAYIKYWTQVGINLSATYKDDDVNVLNDAIKDQEFSLYDKYINLCFVSMAYYHSFGLRNIDLVPDIYHGYYASCFSMVQARIKQETSLAIMVSQYNAATLLIDSMTSFTKQFVENRLMKLFDKIVAISSLFNTLAKQAPLSSTCTK